MHTTPPGGLVFGGIIENTGLPHFDLHLTSDDVIIDVNTRFGGVLLYFSTEFSENLHTTSPGDLVFGGIIENTGLPHFDLHLTSDDVIIDVNTRFGGVLLYFSTEFSENLHTTSPGDLVFGGIIENTGLPHFDLHLTSDDVIIDIYTLDGGVLLYFLTEYPDN